MRVVFGVFCVSPNLGREDSETQVVESSGRVTPAQTEQELLKGCSQPL